MESRILDTSLQSAALPDEIAEYLRTDLALVEDEIQALTDSDTALVREVARYVLSSRGKRLRPMMLLLTARALGCTTDEPIRVAAALEIIHTATLLHDDVIDKADLRRGKASVNARWGDDVAILIADYLYANAFRLAMHSLNPIVLSTICQVTAQMCEGEMFQIEKRAQFLTTDDYLQIVRRKTAFLFSACTGLGSVLASASEEQTLELTRFGLNFGVAFQITDDALDLVSRESELGKDSGTDIRNGKQTLPLIYAYESATADERANLARQWPTDGRSDCVLDLIARYNGVDYALSQARRYANEARTHLSTLKPGQAADYCHQLAEYVVERNR